MVSPEMEAQPAYEISWALKITDKRKYRRIFISLITHLHHKPLDKADFVLLPTK
jgi:hypothetical protein